MIIKKFLHSCILVEDNGKKLLIDPGTFSFVEKKLKPEDIGAVDVIILTHKHPDHFFPEALKAILKLKPAKLIANREISELAKKEGLDCETMKAGESIAVAGFEIDAFDAPHEKIPAEIPHNLAYLINKKILHPGDSLAINAQCEVLCMPVAGPWLRLVDAIELVKRLKPKMAVPIHDAIIKDFFLERIYLMCGNKLSEAGIKFHPLTLGEKLEI